METADKNETTETLQPIPPEVSSRQATINIGVVGQSSHGKSTLVKAISGVQTAKSQSERERCMTIKIGYANAKINSYQQTLVTLSMASSCIDELPDGRNNNLVWAVSGHWLGDIYKCDNPDMPSPQCYTSRGSSHPDEFPCDVAGCKGKFKLVRHVSFLDCPGMGILLATMLKAVPFMHAALFVVGANVPELQPQALEHLAAIEIFKLKNIVILQNKTDLVTKTNVMEQHDSMIQKFQYTAAEGAPILSISAHFKHHISSVLQHIVECIPEPLYNFTASPKLTVIRSFDVNKPGCMKENMKGGVLGGSLLMGILKVGDDIEIRPGIVTKDEKGNVNCAPIATKVVSLWTENTDLQSALPGGLIGVGTNIDPMLCCADKMVGQVLGGVKGLPDIYIELEISYFLLRRLLGVKTEGDKKGAKVQKLSKNEVLVVTIGSLCCGGRVSKVKADLAKLVLSSPVCVEIGGKVTLSRRIEHTWRLIGWAVIRSGVTVTLVTRP